MHSPEGLLLPSRGQLKGAKFVERTPVVDSTPPRTTRGDAVRAKLDLIEADAAVAVKRARERS